ncbi:T9SS type A sorting domain-containing protein, partial [candidate division WOR-3 bacterium]|nr:T9SS type A sorting domain-containing protein [candidate division WOR-3 bacterium]
EPGQYHYWKVVARNGAGLSPSPVREFTTIVAAPDLPELYYPPDGSENVPVEGMVYWYPAARAEGYDVYFGNTNPPPLIGSGTETYYPYSGLANGETYYWQVVATNRGGSTPSAVWSFTTTPVAPSWAEEAVVGGTKVVGAGAALATDQYGNSLYLLKGGGTRELWGFNAWPGGGGWEYLPSIPAKGRDGISRPVKEGGTLVHAGGKLYATKGGRSLDFWEFDLATYGWTQKADVPEGDTGVFSGASAVGYTDPGGWHFVYLLKATGTFEFYRYTVSLDQWDRMPDPPGVPGEEFKEGSALCLGQDSIYALKGGRKAGNFSVYSIGGLWAPFADLPRAGTKNAGAGAALCYHNDTVYCLKGNQTSEFWLYDCGTDEWSPGPEVPVGGAGTTVKNGGAMVYSAYTGLFYATKGQCLEFWSYGPRSGFGRPRGLEAEDDGLQAGQRGADLELMVAPTMFNRAARVSFSLPRAGNVRIGLYDASGRLVRALASGRREAGRYSAGLEAAGLAQGIYVVRFDADGQTFTRTVAIVR